MMMIFFSVMLIMLQMLFYISHPIFFSMVLIIMSILISVFLLKVSVSWFFFLLMLVFLGGVMILIVYMNTLSMNEKFFLKGPTPLDVMIILNGFFFIYILKKNIQNKLNFNNFIPMMVYENMNMMMLMFLMVYLLLTMICVVKLIKYEYGPLIKRL